MSFLFNNSVPNNKAIAFASNVGRTLFKYDIICGDDIAYPNRQAAKENNLEKVRRIMILSYSFNKSIYVVSQK